MMSVDEEVVDLLRCKYLFNESEVQLDAWNLQVLLRIFQRLLSVYDYTFDYHDDTAGSVYPTHRKCTHIQKCLRLLGIDYLVPKIKDMSDKSKALRIISAINDKISSRYSSSDVARRNRVVIKKEQKSKAAKVKSIKETNADERNVDPSVTSQGSVVFQEKWLMATTSVSSSDSTEEDMIPVIPKGRQLPRTPVKASVVPEEELQVLSVDKESGNSTFNVENISEVTKSEELSNHEIKNLSDQRETNYIPTGKQIPRTPHLEEELHSNQDLDNSFVCHNALVLPTKNILTENSNESELKEEALGNETNHAVPLISREMLSFSSCSTEMSRQKYLKEECSKVAASQYPDFRNDRLNAEVVEQIPVTSSSLQNNSAETKILNETFSLSTPAGETCDFKISAECDNMQTSNVTSEFYVGLGNSSDLSNETIKVENEFQQDRTFSVLESPTVSCMQSVSQISSELVCISKSSGATKKLVNYSLNESSPFELPEPKSKMIVITQRNESMGGNYNSVISDVLKQTMSKDKDSEGNEEATEKLSVSLNKDQSELKENVDAGYLSHEGSPFGACLLTPPVGFSDDKTCSGMPKKLLSKTHGTDHPVRDECTHSYLDIASDNTSVQPFVAQVLCDSLGHSFPKLSLGLDENEIENDESRVIHSAQSPVSPHNTANKNETFTQGETSEATLSEILQSWKDTEINCDKNLGIFQQESKIKNREHSMKDSRFGEDSLITDEDSTLVATANSVKEVEFNESFDIFPIKKGKRIAKKEIRISSLGMEGTSDNATRDEEDLKCIKKRQGTLRKEGKIKSSNSLRKNTRNLQAVTQDEPESLLDETYLVKKREVLNEKKIMENDRPVNKKDNQQILRKDEPILIRDEVFLKDSKEGCLKITRNIHADSKENENNSRKLKSSSENKTKQHNGSKRIKRSRKQEDITKSPERSDISYSSPKLKTRPARKTKKNSTKDVLLNKDSNKYTNDNESESCERSLAKTVDLNENLKKSISARSITTKHTKSICFTNTASTMEEEWSRIFDTEENKTKAVMEENYQSELDVRDLDDCSNSFDEKEENGRKGADTCKKIHSDESIPVPVIDSNHKISSVMAPLNIGVESQDQDKKSKHAEETGDKKSLSRISIVKEQNVINTAEQRTMSSKDRKKRKAASKQLITIPSSMLDDEVCADLQSLNLHSCETARPQAIGKENSKTGFAESSSMLIIKQKKKYVDSEQLPECSNTQPLDEIDSQFQALSLQLIEKSNADSVLNDSSPPANKMTKTRNIREERENKKGLCRNKSSISEKKVLVQEIISTNHDSGTDEEKINNKQRARRTQASTSGRNKQINSLEKENVPHDSLNSRAGSTQDKDKKTKICRTKNVDEKKKSIADKSLLENSFHGNAGPTRAPLSRRCKNKALTAISEIYKDSDDSS